MFTVLNGWLRYNVFAAGSTSDSSASAVLFGLTMTAGTLCGFTRACALADLPS
jgi:hypothetical protein